MPQAELNWRPAWRRRCMNCHAPPHSHRDRCLVPPLRGRDRPFTLHSTAIERIKGRWRRACASNGKKHEGKAGLRHSLASAPPFGGASSPGLLPISAWLPSGRPLFKPGASPGPQRLPLWLSYHCPRCRPDSTVDFPSPTFARLRERQAVLVSQKVPEAACRD